MHIILAVELSQFAEPLPQRGVDSTADSFYDGDNVLQFGDFSQEGFIFVVCEGVFLFRVGFAAQFAPAVDGAYADVYFSDSSWMGRPFRYCRTMADFSCPVCGMEMLLSCVALSD